MARAGAEEPSCTEVLAIEETKGGAPAASVWWTDRLLPPTAAAFVNGTRAAALDFDSLHYEATVHPELATLPAAWPCGTVAAAAT